MDIYVGYTGDRDIDAHFEMDIDYSKWSPDRDEIMTEYELWGTEFLSEFEEASFIGLSKVGPFEHYDSSDRGSYL